MITACSSRTSCIISADAGTTCSVAGCDAEAWLSWYWAMMRPPSTLTKVAGKTSTTSLPTNRLSKGASGFGAKFFNAKFFGAKFFGAIYFTSSVGWVAWRCMIPVPMRPHFSHGRLNFKHPFWAAASREKGIFAAFPGYFRTPAGSSPPAEPPGGPVGDPLGEPFHRGFVEHQPHRRFGQLLAIAQKNAALAEQPDCGRHQSPLIRLGLEPAHQLHGKPHEGCRLLAHQFAEHRGRPHRLPIEDAHVAAELVAAQQRAELAADEFGQSRLARHRLHLVGMFELLLGQSAERGAQNLAVKPVLAVRSEERR